MPNAINPRFVSITLSQRKCNNNNYKKQRKLANWATIKCNRPPLIDTEQSNEMETNHGWDTNELSVEQDNDASQKFIYTYNFSKQIICREEGKKRSLQHFPLSMDKSHNFHRELPCIENAITAQKCLLFILSSGASFNSLKSTGKIPFIYRTIRMNYMPSRRFISLWSDSFFSSNILLSLLSLHCTMIVSFDN